MKHLLVAMPQLNVAVGALERNASLMLRAADAAAEHGAAVILFPEMALCGYPPEDLVLKPHFLDDCAAQLKRLERGFPPGPVILAGAPWRDPDGRIANAAVVFQGGSTRAVYRKRHLPNYGVFDEKRLFTPGRSRLVLAAGAARLAVHVCEDTWRLSTEEKALLAAARPDALLNLSASPFHRGKLLQREQVLGAAARSLDAFVLYCNLVGGQDELVFDGGAMVLDPNGALVARAKRFVPDILYFPLPLRRANQEPPPEGPVEWIKLDEPAASGRTETARPLRLEPAETGPAEVYEALCLGIRDYTEKNGFEKTLVALSGGIDSALTACLAADALGAGRVETVTLPSPFTSAETLADARLLAAQLGLPLREVRIDTLYETFLEALRPMWPDRAPDSTEENLQARIRGTLVMALSNKFGWLVLTTGNKSELAMGYCTLYGDMAGGLAVLKDVPKTLVYELARWRNTRGKRPAIPPSTIERPPSAELRPGQRDTDSLPPYDILDAIIEQAVDLERGMDDILAGGFDPAVAQRVVRLIDRNEYKRRQGAPGIKIGPKVFGRERRMPITNRYWEER